MIKKNENRRLKTYFAYDLFEFSFLVVLLLCQSYPYIQNLKKIHECKMLDIGRIQLTLEFGDSSANSEVVGIGPCLKIPLARPLL